MRTIKFRIKTMDDENPEWIYTNHKPHIFWTRFYEGSSDMQNTLGQFTGLHDKNGKEIYEGDIVKTWWEYKDRISGKPVFKDIEVGEVKFGNYETDGDGQGYGNDSITGFYIEKNNSFPDSLRNNFIETIGNIYENPELI